MGMFHNSIGGSLRGFRHHGGGVMKSHGHGIGRVGSRTFDQMGGASMGRTALDFVVNKAIDGSGNLINRFANSDYIKRKMPIAVSYLKNGSDALKDRLRSGYSDIMKGNS